MVDQVVAVAARPRPPGEDGPGVATAVAAEVSGSPDPLWWIAARPRPVLRQNEVLLGAPGESQASAAVAGLAEDRLVEARKSQAPMAEVAAVETRQRRAGAGTCLADPLGEAIVRGAAVAATLGVEKVAAPGSAAKAGVGAAALRAEVKAVHPRSAYPAEVAAQSSAVTLGVKEAAASRAVQRQFQQQQSQQRQSQQRQSQQRQFQQQPPSSGSPSSGSPSSGSLFS